MIIEDFKLRRTIRKYKNDQIPEKMLNELLEVAFRASTTGNMQLYSVIVTRDEENKKKLAPAHFNQPTVTTAPVVLTFCADFNRFIKWCELRKAQHGYDNFQSFYTATIDALLVAQQFCTAAELCGLGICYLGTTTYNAPMIIKRSTCPNLSYRSLPLQSDIPQKFRHKSTDCPQKHSYTTNNIKTTQAKT